MSLGIKKFINTFFQSGFMHVQKDRVKWKSEGPKTNLMNPIFFICSLLKIKIDRVLLFFRITRGATRFAGNIYAVHDYNLLGAPPHELTPPPHLPPPLPLPAHIHPEPTLDN